MKAPPVRPIKPRCYSRCGGPAYVVYPGVVARIDRSYGERAWPLVTLIFEGNEPDLRRAGLLRAEDWTPQRPRGQTTLAGALSEIRSRATMLASGELRLLLEREDAAERDLAFRRFIEKIVRRA